MSFEKQGKGIENMAKRAGTVIYLEMTDAQIAEVNAKGWDGSEIGKLYMAASFKYEDIANIKAAQAARLYKPIVSVEAENAEQVWVALQSLDSHWSETIGASPVRPLINHFHGKARSMNVGDIIVWQDGEAEVVASAGFQKINWKEIEG